MAEIAGSEFETLYSSLCNVFVTTVTSNLEELRSAVAHDNADEIERLAHLMKSMGNNIGAYRFAKACEELEHAASDVQSKRYSQLYSAIENAMRETCKALDEQDGIEMLLKAA